MTDTPTDGVPVAPLDRPTYTAAAIAKRWGCSQDIVRRMLHSGELRGFRVGSRLMRVRADELAAHEARRGSSAGKLGPRLPQEPTASDIAHARAQATARMQKSARRIAERWIAARKAGNV